MRVNLSVAIVAMVTHNTSSTFNTTAETEELACPVPDGNDTSHAYSNVS